MVHCARWPNPGEREPLGLYWYERVVAAGSGRDCTKHVLIAVVGLAATFRYALPTLMAKMI
jgi:hypothetical protein